VKRSGKIAGPLTVCCEQWQAAAYVLIVIAAFQQDLHEACCQQFIGF
jgi:hypothetical protein